MEVPRPRAAPGGLETVFPLIAAWRTSNRVTTYLIENLPPELWAMTVPGAPRRTVRMIAAHIHNVRCMWIKMLGARHGVAVPRAVDGRRVRPAELLRALARSSAGIVSLLKLGAARGGQVPRAAWQNFPTDLAHFVSYFVAHEGHHRGQLCLLARQLGRRLPAEVTAGLWQWSKRAREQPLRQLAQVGGRTRKERSTSESEPTSLREPAGGRKRRGR